MSAERRIGPYEIVREIARGGMGVVYEVRHPNVPRPLALKIILDRRRADASVDIKRFEREAQLLAQVDRHPNVLKVHQFSQENGLYYLVTDFIAGDSLAASMPMPPENAARVARKLADALSYVHAKGIIHRDLKPQNVLLREGDETEPVLVDFGLAWSADAERLTKTNTTVGTPAYMSPEQLGGGGSQLDGRTDVYALGATLYSALTGDAPFEATSVPELVGKILMEPPPRPSSVNPEVPRALDAIVWLALAKRREDRYEHAAAMRDDLDRFLRGEAPLAAKRLPSTAAVKARRFGLATVGVAALLAGGIALAVVGARSARRAAHGRALEAALQAARAAAQGRRGSDARARTDALDSALGRLDATEAPPDGDPRARPRLGLVAAFLRAEVEAAGAGATDREHAVARATEAAREYLEATRALGFDGAPVKDELLDDVPSREAELAAALAGAAPPELVERLLARPADASLRPVHLERARAFLRLGKPRRAAEEAELAQGNDPPGLEARLLLGRASLARRDLARARDAAAAAQKGATETAQKAARALAAEVELEAGDQDAAEAALGAASEPGADLAASLRLELALARRVPAEVVAADAASLVRRARDGAVALRATEILGRAQVLEALESFAPREAAPTFDEAAATLRTIPGLLARPGGADARPQAARGLVLLAALAGRPGTAAALAERASLLERASEADPTSPRVALARAALARSLALPAREKAAAALDETAGGLADAATAGGLGALAAWLRGGGDAPGASGDRAARLALVARLEQAATGAALPAERARFALAAHALGSESSAPRLELARAGADLLDASGSLEGRLLDVGRERVAFLRTVEAFALHAAALDSASRTRKPDEEDAIRVVGRIVVGLRASRARGDAPVALAALDLGLALVPDLTEARGARAEAVAFLAAPVRGDVKAILPDAADPSPAARALLQARPLATLAPAALEDLAAAATPAPGVASACLHLVRGRLLAARGSPLEAAPELDAAAREAAPVFATTFDGDKEMLLPTRVEAQRVAAAALFERALVLESAGAPDAAPARTAALADLEERGRRGLEAQAFRRALSSDGGDMAAMASQEVVDKLSGSRFRTSRAHYWSPVEEDALDSCVSADMDLGMTARAWTALHRLVEVRGPMPFSYPNWAPRRFQSYLTGNDPGAATTLFTVELFAQLAKDSAPEDGAAVLAEADRRIYALPVGPRARRASGEVALTARSLREAHRRSPGCAGVYQSRAVLAAAAGELDAARALFARFRELGAGGTLRDYLLFEALAYGRFGIKEGAKNALERFLADASPDPEFDAWFLDQPAFAGCREMPEVAPLIQEIRRRFPGKR